MFAPPVFAFDDQDEISGFIRHYPFAALVINGADGPLAAHIPLAIDGGAPAGTFRLIGHVHRANPFWKSARDQRDQKALGVFCATDAYISPSFYPSKATDSRQVPTWNYERVEVRGLLTIHTEPGEVERGLRVLTDQMEAGREEPWRVDDAPEEFRTKLSRAIVGVTIDVDASSGVRKLSQNKSLVDRDGVRAGLLASPMRGARESAGAMDRLFDNGDSGSTP